MILVRLQDALGSYDRKRALTVKRRKNPLVICNRKYNYNQTKVNEILTYPYEGQGMQSGIISEPLLCHTNAKKI